MNQYGYELCGSLIIIFLLACFFKSNMYQTLLLTDKTNQTPPHQILPITAPTQDIISYNDPISNPCKPFSICHIPRFTQS